MPRAYRSSSAQVKVCVCGCDRAFVTYDRRRVYYDQQACKQAAYRARRRRRRVAANR